MKQLIWIVLSVFFIGTANSSAAQKSDPRFFGTYCGGASVQHCVKYKVKFLGITISQGTKCKTIHFDKIRAQINHTATTKGGLINGEGSAVVDGTKIGFAVAGVVTGHGLARGSAILSGRKPSYGTVSLSSDGLAATVHAYGKSITVRKDQCGNTPPEVAITSIPQTPLEYGRTYFFSGEVTDKEDMPTPSDKFAPERLTWKHDNYGFLKKGITGLVARTNTLLPGLHKVTFSATDSGGLTSSVSAFVTVKNQSPEKPTIFKPQESDTVIAGCDTLFLGQAYDPEDGWLPTPNLSGGDSHKNNLIWESNVDGMLGWHNKKIVTQLNTPGEHIISLTAYDSLGMSSSMQKVVQVQPQQEGGCANIVEIIKPSKSEWKGIAIVSKEKKLFVGSVTFGGSNDDSTIVPTAPTVEWTATPIHPSGPTISLGNTLVIETTQLVSIGGKTTEYKVKLTATDSDGNKASDEMTLYVMVTPVL